MAKIWDKGFDANKQVEAFTVGNDRELDLRLANMISRDQWLISACLLPSTAGCR